MEELGIPELTTEQTELLCSAAENAAKKYVLSKVSSKAINRLDIAVEVEGTKPIKVTVEIDLLLSPDVKNINVEILAKAAVDEAYMNIETFLRKLK